jgi:CO dehydrogenase flavoprotein C-terminal domain
MPAGAGYALEEFSRRHGDFAIVGIAAMIVREGQRCTVARLATAGAGPVPVRLRAAEENLERDGLGDAAIEAAARRATELVSPDADIHASADYRRHLTGVLSKRASPRRARRVARAGRAGAAGRGRGAAQSRGGARRLSGVRTPRSPKSVRRRLEAGASLWTGALLRQRIP